MTPSELNGMLVKDIHSVVRYLLPGGIEKAGEWETGSLAGEAGKSCKVCLSGNKAGVWTDFATGEAGDLIELWKGCKGLKLPDALKEIKEFLGVKDNHAFDKPSKKYTKPARPQCKVIAEESPASAFFKSRGITKKTIDKYKIAVGQDSIVFPYLCKSELVMYKTRSLKEKKFFASKDTESILFGWQVMPENARAVIITEGEIDAMSFYEQGYPCLSVPFGGGGGKKQKWIENEFDRLQQFDQIFLALDMDEQGAIATSEIIERLGRHRCMIVPLPMKDANECHMAGIDLSTVIEKSKTLDPEELKSVYDIYDDVYNYFFPVEGSDIGMRTPWPKMGDLVLFRKGEVSIWTGINGHGKSQALGHVCVDGISQGYNVCIASMEMKPSHLVGRMIRQQGGCNNPTAEYLQMNMDKLQDNLWLFKARGTARVEKIFEVFKYARARYGVDVFVIDSLAKCGFAEDDYNGQKGFVDKICEFAEEHDVHVHLVTHSKKKANEKEAPGKMDVKGSGAITDMVDNVFSVWRNKDKESLIQKARNAGSNACGEILEKPDATIKCEKQRNGDWEGEIYLWFDRESYQYLENYGIGNKRYLSN
jgi:twinkle protein